MTTGRDRPVRGRRRALVALAGLGMLGYLGAAIATDASSLRHALVTLGATGTAGVLALSLLNYLLRFQRWHLYLDEVGHRVPWGQHLLVYLGGFIFTVSPAKAGEAVRGIWLKDHGVSYSVTFATLFVERLLDFTAYALLALLIASEVHALRPLLAGAFVVVAVLLTAVGHPRIPGYLDGLAHNRSLRVTAALAWLADLLRSSRRLLAPRLVLPGLLLGVISWGAEGFGFWLICHGLDLHIAQTTAIGIYAIAGLAGAAAFFMPGGIGGMEVAMTALLTASGAPLPLAIVATLLCRLATLWFAVLVGAVCVALLELQGLRRPETRPSL